MKIGTIWHVLLITSVFSPVILAQEEVKEIAWGEPLNGLRMRVTLPGRDVYTEGSSVPFFLELQNIEEQSVKLNLLIPYLRYQIQDIKGNLIGNGAAYEHLTVWEGDSRELGAGVIKNEVCYLQKLRLPEKTPNEFQIRFELPTQKEVPNQLPITGYSNSVKIKLQSPIHHSLRSEDLPNEWEEHMTLTYREGGSIWYGNFAMQIAGNGQITLVATGLNRQKNIEIENGKYVYQKPLLELEYLLEKLRGFTIERLNQYDQKRYVTDVNQAWIMIQYKGNVFLGAYQEFQKKCPEVIEFQKIMHDFIKRVQSEGHLMSEQRMSDQNEKTPRGI